MRMTLGKKLALGFTVVIGMSALSAAVAYHRIGQLERSVEVAVDQSLPSVLAAQALVGDIYATLAALRGYLLLGHRIDDARLFKAERADAWRDLDKHLTELRSLSQNWESVEKRQSMTEVDELAAEFRDRQQQIEEIAQTEDNLPALRLMTTDLLPLGERMDAAITHIISEEVNLEATLERKALLHTLALLKHTHTSALSELRLFLLHGDDESRDNFDERIKAFKNAHEALVANKALLTPTQRSYWNQYMEACEEFLPIPDRLLAWRAAPDWNKANFLLATEAIPRARRILAILDGIGSATSATAAEHRQAIAANSKAVTTTLIASSIIAIVIAGIIAVCLSRRIVGGIQEVVAGARQVAGGELAGDDLPVRTQDEVGALALAFNAMRVGLREMAGQIRQATENVNATAAEMLASTQQQACAAKEQAATVQQITSTLEEINQSGDQIGDRAKEVSATVEDVSGVTERGMSATREASETMQYIRDQVEEVAENVVSVSERTQTIGEIIATVSEIAEQSNLLALNAGIEAVSAGEQGGRFSVVAHEMKNLADRAKDCTVQVRTILGEIQKGINTSVMMTEEAVKRVEVGKQRSSATETTMREVTETNVGSIRAFQQIIAGVNQQQIGVGQVTQGMQDIRQAIEQTAAGTAQMEKAAANMNALSQQLKDAVARYKV